jgi:hypothetical protein
MFGVYLLAGVFTTISRIDLVLFYQMFAFSEGKYSQAIILAILLLVPISAKLL